jgi:hypothetical protein
MVITVGDALNAAFNGALIGVILWFVYDHWRRRKYEKIAREMFRDGKLNAGTVWKHYHNEKLYTIQAVSNYLAHGIEWPLTIVYLSEKGHALYSRPAHEFIRKFSLVDSESNAAETPLDRLVALSFYLTNRIDFPEVGSKWYHEFRVPTGHLNAFLHMEYKNEVEFAIIESVTNKDQPCPYVNYRDEKGNLQTISLHHFRNSFLLCRDHTPVYCVILSAANCAAIEKENLPKGSILTVNEVTDTEVVLAIFDIKIRLVFESTEGFFAGDQYVFEDGKIQFVPTNKGK